MAVETEAFDWLRVGLVVVVLEKLADVLKKAEGQKQGQSKGQSVEQLLGAWHCLLVVCIETGKVLAWFLFSISDQVEHTLNLLAYLAVTPGGKTLHFLGAFDLGPSGKGSGLGFWAPELCDLVAFDLDLG